MASQPIPRPNAPLPARLALMNQGLPLTLGFPLMPGYETLASEQVGPWPRGLGRLTTWISGGGARRQGAQ